MRVQTQLYPALCNPMDCSPPGSSVHGFSQWGYWSGLPFPPPGDLPNPGIKLTSPQSPELTDEFLYHWATWKALNYIQKITEINPICEFCVFPSKRSNLQTLKCSKKKTLQVSKNLYIWIKILFYLLIYFCAVPSLVEEKTHSEPWIYRKYLKVGTEAFSHSRLSFLVVWKSSTWS